MDEQVLDAVTEVKQEVVVPNNQIMIDNIVPGNITWNYAELKSYLTEVSEKYKDILVSVETKKDATTTKNKLSQMKKDLDTQRKYIKGKMSEPITTMEGQFKELIGILDTAYTNIMNQLNELEQQEKAAKKAKVEAWVEQIRKKAEERMGLSKAYSDRFVIDEKWLNKTTSDKTIQEGIITQFNTLIEQQRRDTEISEAIGKAVESANTDNELTKKLRADKYLEYLKLGKSLAEILEIISRDAVDQRKSEELIKQKAKEEVKAEQMKAADFVSQPGAANVVKTSEIVSAPSDTDTVIEDFVNKSASEYCYVYAFAGDLNQMKALGDAFKTLGIEFKPIKAYQNKIQKYPKVGGK